MKKIIPFFLLLLPFLLFSQNINKAQLTQYGKVAFIQKSSHIVQNTHDLHIKATDFIVDEQSSDTLLMVIDFEDLGFIILSADESAYPVLAYSLDETFDMENPSPASLYLLNSYAEEIQDIKRRSLPADEKTMSAWTKIKENHPVPSSKSISNGYLLTSRWNQSKYYNAYSPQDPDSPPGYDGRVPNGCVALAMAQILYYYRFPETGQNSHTNYTNYGDYHVNFGEQHYHYEAMLDELNSWNNEVAKLIFHCATSVDMMYDPSGSGAYSQDVPDALKTYFNYASSTRQVSRNNNQQWKNTIKNQIDQGRPVYYSGYNEDGGHAFVCDGYDEEEYFHFNLGWGGSGNGYYLIGSANDNSGGFPHGQAAVIDIYPTGSYPYFCQETSEPLTSYTGTLEDGSHAENYQNNMNCTYIIAPPNANSFTIKIQNLDTEENHDVLSFWEGDPENGGTLHSSYSGNLTEHSFNIETDILYIRFTTNSSNTASGWRIHYQATDIPNCYLQTLKDNSGTFTDGSNEEENYWANQSCSWSIFPNDIQGTEYITLSFPKFDISPEDEVIVKNYWTSHEILAHYKGNDIPQEATYYTKRIKVEFKSDNWLEKSGFTAQWKTNLHTETNGIEESLADAIALYPNPTTDYFNIQLPASASGDWNMTLYDITGRALINAKITIGSGQTHQVDVSNLSSGFYWIKLQNEQVELSKKVIIRK